jgi:hypothetical protein
MVVSYRLTGPLCLGGEGARSFLFLLRFFDPASVPDTRIHITHGDTGDSG